ncbi:MAG: ThiF family adenylyltransferase [Pirellulaceae bacterium]
MNSTTTGPPKDRFERQRGLLDTTLLQTQKVTIIGVGAIGRQVAIQLASLGVGHIQLVDFDMVENHNVTSQGYLRDDIGIVKVISTAEAIRRIDPSITVEAINDRFRPTLPILETVFCCVDSISARSVIWKSACSEVKFWTDGRMLGEVIRVLAASDENSKRYYPTSLFEQQEAQVGSCTSRSTIYAASIAAGLMVHQFTRQLRGLPIDQDLQLNLFSSELSVQSSNADAFTV